MTEVKPGSRWWSQGRDFYHVIDIVNIEGQVWVHYRKDYPIHEDNAEFSCHLESFLSRFTPYENTSR